MDDFELVSDKNSSVHTTPVEEEYQLIIHVEKFERELLESLNRAVMNENE